MITLGKLPSLDLMIPFFVMLKSSEILPGRPILLIEISEVVLSFLISRRNVDPRLPVDPSKPTTAFPSGLIYFLVANPKVLRVTHREHF